MKPSLSVLVALGALCAHAAVRNPDVETAREYYTRAEFGKAAARFQVLCNTGNDAEACYWTGISYERLADISTPFGCRIDAKAHQYFSKAMKLAPEPKYRDALFDFLLDTADCSRTALGEAAGMLVAIPESDPGYSLMRSRLESQRHLSASMNARLARLFLSIPRASYRVAWRSAGQ